MSTEVVGFKKISIQILDDDLKPVTGKLFELSGVTNKGATSSFEINGLTKEATKVYGSNIPYFVSQKGTGDVTATISLLDFPFDSEAEVLGFSKNSDGVITIGEDTEAPYCSILMEAGNPQSEPLAFGLYAGKFSRETFQGSTLTNEAYEMGATEYTFTAISKVIDDKGCTVGYAEGTTAVASLKGDVLGATTP